MKRLSRKQTIYLHSMAIKKTGGLDGIRDEGLLDSALNSPFLDGNKKIGILAMMVFLDINGIELECSDEDIMDLGIGIASGKYSDEYMIEWIVDFSN
jgi:death-on-curing protein